MKTDSQDLLEDVALALEHVRNQRSGPPSLAPPAAAVPSAPAPNPWSGVLSLFDKLPAWITLIALAIVGYASLNTRVTTVEYQNQVSIADRTELHTKIDKADSNLSELKTNVEKILTKLEYLTGRKP